MVDKDTAAKLLKFGAGALVGLSPIGAALFAGTELMTDKAKDLKENGTIDQLSEEVKKQDLYYQMMEYQAKLAQELAISQRIATAEEVEIEEYYEGEGNGSLGLNAKEGNVSLGASGSGRKVTKRIYRFTGFNELSSEILDEDNLLGYKSQQKN